jgi:hypothetical protein
MAAACRGASAHRALLIGAVGGGERVSEGGGSLFMALEKTQGGAQVELREHERDNEEREAMILALELNRRSAPVC